MNKLDVTSRARILACLVEGNSIRATCRMTGAAKGTVLRLLAEVGSACLDYQDGRLRKLPCKRVQVDEIWSFVGAKERNTSPEQRTDGMGDIWTWTALCADTKLAICWHVGERNAAAARDFIADLAGRLAGRIQLTSDGLQLYIKAVEAAFGGDVDYAQLVKIYGAPADGQRRYSPPECIGAELVPVNGNPDKKHISTSYVERQNLTMRMHMRRFTRLTNAFSKKVENHAHAVSLHFMYYNFCRVHQKLRVTPAMEAGVTDHVWELSEIIEMADTAEVVTDCGSV
ncbi:MAG: IS1 family transposase [Burkholderiales bacterium]|nr:IS1 family transposase [Burkholderiales bacterium]OJX08793.1 MAG: IS1 transposase [Burkholderiales bacterium 70-64]